MRAQRLRHLQEAITAIECGRGCTGSAVGGSARASRSNPDELPVPPGLHEWFGLADAPRWIPPLGILLYLVNRSLTGEGSRAVAWIGRHCWPFLHGLPPADRNVLLARSIFIDPPDEMSRLWAIDLAARCPATAVVVTDGSGLNLAATRRLQLAAESGSARVLCARPPREMNHLSAATTRWLVRSAPSADKIPRWNVQLLRCKGMQPDGQWTVEWKSAQGGVVVHAVLADRPDPASKKGALVRRSA